MDSVVWPEQTHKFRQLEKEPGSFFFFKRTPWAETEKSLRKFVAIEETEDCLRHDQKKRKKKKLVRKILVQIIGDGSVHYNGKIVDV